MDKNNLQEKVLLIALVHGIYGEPLRGELLEEMKLVEKEILEERKKERSNNGCFDIYSIVNSILDNE